MKWIEQKKEPNCGQIAVAVITGKDLKIVYDIIGHSKYTDTKELSRALYFLGYDSSGKLKTLKEKPKLAIGKLSYPKRNPKRWDKEWHWVVIDGDKIYDGAHGNNKGEVIWKRGWKITSYLPITKMKLYKHLIIKLKIFLYDIGLWKNDC